MVAEEHNGALDKASKQVKPSAGILKRLLGVLLLAFLLIGGGIVAGLVWLDSRLNQPNEFGEHTFIIARGDSLETFTTQLIKAGVVDEPYSLNLAARYKGLAGKLHTGHYQFEEGMSLLEVLDSITSGNHLLSYNFTFVPGSTFKQIRKAMRSEATLKQTLSEKTDAQILALLDEKQQYSHPEGLFFPETYAYLPGDSDEDILRRAYDIMQSTLAELWEKRDKDIKISTPYEALILASIIEKETAMESERPLISGVFMNRLKKGMRLQTDPTVVYGLGDNYKGNITRKHLETDTPYNTYTRKGLPPTPISMPGRAAIQAALNPEPTDAIYFVALGDGSGGHYFSTTLAEHNRAVKRYLKALKKRG